MTINLEEIVSNMKPCPFCGGKDIFFSLEDSMSTKWGQAECQLCSAKGPPVRTGYDVSKDAEWVKEAAYYWNNMHQPREDK